ncbi:MAG TPA: cytochrome c3 family protein [Polyangiaceae bacterium LLY-WYZ-15_(1-7)]|nr:cytochrome C [Sandaracinus sp.]HJK94672.1 cytochrome c3 family protein [Polyangiaceae bacterium LLY-WYZ-15_(1-7)]MBJ70793.1 cytochrome C [Sandaracinus sp.]HJL04591.1 cytochrome c3 family protein [Polyangiaceae bacterium LLY-WYZ-15_(1-7)]HJL07373.1 cytochrome c3 family protein [Polyangiaceae bacterium LLY-WYZ-15_(1-7)]
MQIFPRQLNLLPLVLGAAAFVGGGVLTFVVWYYFSPKHLQVGYAPEQPVPYSHRLHAGELGMDCRYCHSNVEYGAYASVPPTQTCMGCHSIVWPESGKLAPIRESWETGESVEWVKAHVIPDHAYFNHSVHVSAGVGCVSCHGRIDQMEVVRVDQPIAMQWCLECHRDPGPNLRPPSEVTNMEWEPDDEWLAAMDEHVAAVNPPEHCSGCHR